MVVVVIIYPVPFIHGSLGAGVGAGERGPLVCLRAPPPTAERHCLRATAQKCC